MQFCHSVVSPVVCVHFCVPLVLPEEILKPFPHASIRFHLKMDLPTHANVGSLVFKLPYTFGRPYRARGPGMYLHVYRLRGPGMYLHVYRPRGPGMYLH